MALGSRGHDNRRSPRESKIGQEYVGAYRFNEGRFLNNSLLVRENLGKHTAAERLLRNMCRWAAADTAKPLAPLLSDFHRQLKAIGYLNP
jgi:hypothetical protein